MKSDTLPAELLVLEAATFEVADIVDPSTDLNLINSSSCSTSSCCSCSSSCTSSSSSTG